MFNENFCTGILKKFFGFIKFFLDLQKFFWEIFGGLRG